jgi:hypothetical protein
LSSLSSPHFLKKETETKLDRARMPYTGDSHDGRSQTADMLLLSSAPKLQLASMGSSS